MLYSRHSCFLGQVNTVHPFIQCIGMKCFWYEQKLQRNYKLFMLMFYRANQFTILGWIPAGCMNIHHRENEHHSHTGTSNMISPIFQLMTVWGWLPARYTVCHPQLSCIGTASHKQSIRESISPHMISPVFQLMTIWCWLPARYTVCQPQLLYTSEEQGISLRTLYSKIDYQEPTLFVIKTTRNEVNWLFFFFLHLM